MDDRFAGLRCRPGDLAVITRDVPECQSNVGQVVRVVDEYIPFREEPNFYWLIEPLSSQPSAVPDGSPGSKDCAVVYDREPRAHEDTWMHPLRGKAELADMNLITDLLVKSEMRVFASSAA